MIPSLLLVVLGGFGSFSGTGSAGGGSAPLRAPIVAFYGDSLVQGVCSGTAPPVALDGLLRADYVVINRGVSGETAHEIAERVISGAATACLGEPCGTYILEGGVNTLKHGAFNEASTTTVVGVALNGDGGADDAHDLGMLDAADHLRATYPRAQVLAVGVLPYAGCTICGINPSPGARAAAYNAALVSACASRPWLTCLVPYDDFEDPQNADRLLPAYACEDGSHLINAGSAALAQEVYDAGTW